MAVNHDGTVTLRTVRKVASTPSGNGMNVVKNVGFKSAGAGGGDYVRKQPGRTVVDRSARGR